MNDTLRTFVLDEVNGMIDSLAETVTHEDMGRVLFELRDAVRDGTWQPTPTAELLRTEDMAPGTTFDHPTRWEVGHRDGETGRASVYMVSNVGVSYLDELDPSTIRDVTPPKGDDRG